jgi:hypothetical protein
MANTVSRTISDETLSRIIHIESGGRPTAKAPTSSALGLGQFLNATWLETVRKHRPDWLVQPNDQVLARRLVPRDSIEMLARFTEDNAKALGPGYTDGDLYLAHFSGVGTARSLLRAPASAPASSVYSQAAIRANRSILEGKTCGEVREWASRKMQGASGRNWVAVHWSGAKPVAPPAVKPPAMSPGTKAATAGATVVVGGAGAAAAGAGLSAIQVTAIILGASLVAGAALLIIYRITKGFWPWTGNQSQALSLPLPPLSEKSLELASAQLALSSEDLPAKPSPLPSEPSRRRKRSAKPSPRTRTPRKNSKGLKRKGAKKSSPKRKSKSRN